jgi:PKD repeat protein/sugar lactone lactonase YvrE
MRSGSGSIALFVLFLLLVAGAVQTVSGAETYRYVATWGSSGSENGQFDAPVGIASNATGYLYVTDRDNDRVQVFAPDGTFAFKWGSHGSGIDQFNCPIGIAIDGAGNVYVADSLNHRVQKFNAAGQSITAWGSSGSADGQFENMEGIAVDAAGHVYVTGGRDDNRVQVFDSAGVHQQTWTGFAAPAGVAVSPVGDQVYVAEYLGDHVQIRDTSGTIIGGWGSTGSGNGQFKFPVSLAVDAAGNVYATDAFNCRVQKFYPNGQFARAWGSSGSGDGQFSFTYGVAVAPSGDVSVVDAANDRIQQFALLVVHFSANTTSGAASLPIQFTESIVGTGVTGRSWDFGDGGSSNAINPIHTYTTAGTYTVNLTATAGDTSLTETRSAYITVSPAPAPAISLLKEISVDGGSTWVHADTATGPYSTGSPTLRYRFNVTNNGDVALSNVGVEDSAMGTIAVASSLDPGVSSVVTVTTAGWHSGQQSGTATATGKYNSQTVTATDTTYYFGASPGVTVEVQVSADSGSTWQDADSSPGPTIRNGTTPMYKYWVTNSGNVPLSSVTLTDSVLGAITIPSTLAVGASADTARAGTWSVGSHAITATANGSFTDSAGATTWYPDQDSANWVGIDPAVAITVYTNGQDANTAPGPYLDVGDAVTWTYVVTNTGDCTLTGVAVADDRGVTVSAPKSTLVSGESMTATASGTAVAGQYANNGTVSGTPAVGSAITATDPSHYYGAAPSISIVTFTNGEDANTTPGPNIAVGNTVSWNYTVTNTGNVALTNVVVTDDRGVSVSAPKTTLAVGETWNATASGTAVAGQYTNNGTVSGTPPVGSAITATDSSHYYGVSSGIAIRVYTNSEDANTAPGPLVPVGDPVLWTYTVTNTGNCVLTSVAVVDDRGVTVTCPKSTLSVGESMTGTATGTAVVGQYVNNGTVTATPPTGPAVTATNISHYRGLAQPVASFTSDVSTGAVSLRVAFTDTSTGTVDARSWSFGDGGTSTLPNPSHTYTSTGTYTVTLRVSNPLRNATATGTIVVTARSGFDAYPQYGSAPLNVSFLDYSASASTWYWSFGDGANSTLQSPHHVYTTPGLYSVSLAVTSGDGRKHTVTRDNLVHVVGSAPVTTTTSSPSLLPVSGGIGVPRDLDGDGLYDDLNGNGRLDFADVTLFFAQMTWIAANEPVAAFDFNGNGRIDFADVTWLFQHL